MSLWIFTLCLCWYLVGTNDTESRKHSLQHDKVQKNEELAEIDKLLSVKLDEKIRGIDRDTKDLDKDLEVLESVLKSKAAKRLRLRNSRWICWTCDYSRVDPYKDKQRNF